MKPIYFTLALLLISLSIVNAQEFELKIPNIKAIQEELKKSNHSKETIYVYLNQSYGSTTKKINVKKYDYPDYAICGFTQKFEHAIVYEQEQCDEGGMTSKLVFPKTDKQLIIKWVEAIYESSLMDIKNKWNSEKTKFSPVDDGAGCYFELKETKTHSEIELYCGC